MTALYFSSFEANDITLERFSSGNAGSWTFSTAHPRTGTYSLAFDGDFFLFNGVEYTVSGLSTGKTYYLSDYIYFDTLPSSNTFVDIVDFWNASGQLVSVRFKPSDNKLYLHDGINNADVGSPSAAISAGVWYHIELSILIAAAGNDSAEFRLNESSIASSSALALSTTALTGWDFMAANGSTTEAYTLYHDDVAFNSSDGSVNNGFPGSSYIVTLFPVSDNANGGWSKPGGATTDLWSSVNNTPPVGIADSTSSANAEKQIRNPTSTAGENYDANMTSYTNAGVGASDVIKAIQWIMAIGTSSTTGTNNGVARLVSNPDQGSDQTINFEGAGGTAGTYPSNWFIEKNTIIESPIVTKATSPVLRITKNTAATRVHLCCAMQINVLCVPVTGGVLFRRTDSDRIGSRS